MPLKSLLTASLVLLALAGCTSGAANNTDYARPADTGGGIRIPIN